VSVAGLTIYDMCKAVDKTMRVTNIRLISKTKTLRLSLNWLHESHGYRVTQLSMPRLRQLV